jgi:hypothetical protein
LARRTPAVTGPSAPPATTASSPPSTGDEDGALVAEFHYADVGNVERAAVAELGALGVDFKTSALAAAALELARQLDHPRNSATAKSLCAGRLVEALDRLRELNPPAQEDSPLDEVRRRRDARIADAARGVHAGG